MQNKDERLPMIFSKSYDPIQKRLLLASKALNDEDIPALLLFIKQNPTSTLILCRNLITDKGAILISTLSNTKIINLALNRIGDPGVEAFECSKSIQHLDLYGNCITNTGIASLAKNKTLYTVDYKNDSIDEETQTLLKHQLIRNKVNGIINQCLTMKLAILDEHSPLYGSSSDILAVICGMLLITADLKDISSEVLFTLVEEIASKQEASSERIEQDSSIKFNC